MRTGGRRLLHFGAVDHRADVWVNGSLVASHRGGHTPFSADVTAALVTAGGENTLVVRAEDSADLAQARGKQHWGERPEEVWYQRTTGIWQPVWLEAVPLLHISSVRWNPDLPHSRLGVEVELNAAPRAGLQLRVELRRGDGTLVADDLCALTGPTLTRTVGIDLGAPSIARRRDLVWSPEYPNLLEHKLPLLEGGHGSRPGQQLCRTAQCGRPRRAGPHQRLALLPAAGPGAGVLAAHSSGCT